MAGKKKTTTPKPYVNKASKAGGPIGLKSTVDTLRFRRQLTVDSQALPASGNVATLGVPLWMIQIGGLEPDHSR
jgi:hypothetical protein